MFGKPSEEIKEKLDIVDLISEYIQLKPAGANFRACCPFHNEKTPSFMVSRDKQIFKCFGCNFGGDVFSFVMKMEGLEFVDALKLLADKAGVKLKQFDPKISSRRTKILNVLELAAEFYHQALLKSKSGQVARDYLKKRGVSDLICDEFKLGFAPDDWEMLSKFLKSRNYKDDEILGSGMAIKKQRGFGYYDRFRYRIMFPIRDIHGNVVGFTARVLREDEKMGKYINTPQTLVYDKSRVIYGLDKAKTEIRRAGNLVIVEGNMDVIASHQVGVKNVVASSGTALTAAQVEIVKRYTNNVVFSFDTDAAGGMATRRGIDLALLAGVNVKIAVPSAIKGVKDPDELIKKKGVKAWKDLIAGAKNIMDYYFDSTLLNLDLKKVENKKTAAKILLPIIKKIPDNVEQTHYLQKLAANLKVSEEVLRQAIEKIVLRQVQDFQKKYYYNNKKSVMPILKKTENEFILERLFGLVLFDISHLKLLENLDSKFLTDSFKELYKQIKEYYNKNQIFDFKLFVLELEKIDSNLALKTKEYVLGIENEQISLDRGDIFDVELEIKKYIKRLNELDLKKQLRNVESQMREAENSKDLDKINVLSQQFNELSGKLNIL